MGDELAQPDDATRKSLCTVHLSYPARHIRVVRAAICPAW
jgi:hypothetical protein